MIALVMKALSVIGFLLLVTGYLLNQRGRLAAVAPAYLAMNTFGALLLASYSVFIGEWVFVALEGFWSAASAHAWIRAEAGRT